MHRECTIEGCTRPYEAKGLCHGHYMRLWRNGDPGPAELRPYSGSDAPRTPRKPTEIEQLREQVFLLTSEVQRLATLLEDRPRFRRRFARA